MLQAAAGAWCPSRHGPAGGWLTSPVAWEAIVGETRYPPSFATSRLSAHLPLKEAILRAPQGPEVTGGIISVFR